ncbi:DUF4174 domain-containing protein [Alkalilacustris brevis]|uniref:DUF4174 domain-containing protein n=1 Tax=Alkalilacustris brevis TaxID=2026338 RepID=UPI000E0CFF1C|nr:DUF4174 domain-containing protein [Alkalilacustris brevis]
MKPFRITILAACLPLAALAQEPITLATDGAAPAAEAQGPEAATGTIAEDALMEDEIIEGLQVHDAAEVDLEDFLWTMRPIVIFADIPNDPSFERQVRYLEERADEMIARDVVVVLDTDPSANSQARERLRPRGFMLAILDKDGEVKLRRPNPRPGREIVQTIDKFPSRRQEILDRLPSGRD